MKIAIVGAGFSGLAVAWELISCRDVEVTIFDSRAIGDSTSGMAAGLLHPYAGLHAKLNAKGHEGIEATTTLLSVATKVLGSGVIAQDLGIIRLALSESQKIDYSKSPALQDPNVEWIDAETSSKMIPGCVNAPGLWIKNGMTVYSQAYLKGLWKACQKLGAQFTQRHVSSLKELDHFDLCIVTAGAETVFLPELSSLRLTRVKGQILELEWPNSIAPLDYALNSQIYIIMSQDKKTCLIGSTFEKNFINDEVNIKRAMIEILPRAIEILPFLEGTKVVKGYAGIRSVTPNHLPYLKQFNAQTWILSGMGSKGLLYHALMAKELVNSVKI